MHKKRPNKHSKSKSNTLHFGGRHSLINKYKSKIKSNDSNSSKHNKNTNKNNISHADNHNLNHSDKAQFKLPPLTQLENDSNNNVQSTSFNSITINNNILVHTSPSASHSIYYTQTQKGRLDATISISSETNYQRVFQQLPPSPSASYSFSDNNSITNPDFIVIEPQIQHQHQHHSHHQFHPPQHKHFTNFPPPKTFKFDENDNDNPKYMTNILITNNISNQSTQSQTSSQPPSAAITPTTNIIGAQISPSNLSQLSHTERFQQLQPDPSSTAMTPTPSPSAPCNWSSSPMHPMSLNSSSPNLSNLDLNPNPNNNDNKNNEDCNNTLAKPKRYGSRSHLMDEQMENEHKRDSIKNVKIGQTTMNMHPYRVYNEHEYEHCNLLDKPANSIKSIGSAISIETEHSISRSLGANEEYEAIPQNYGNYNPSKLTTAHTNNSKKDKLKDIRIKLTPTTSTPIKNSPNHSHTNSHNNVTWQTYIGHFVFHEHDRGHSLYHSFKKIGEGVFARVYKTVRKEPQRTVALKVFPKKNLHAEGSFANELMLLHNVSHPNIVKLYDAHVDPKYFYLEMEVCRGGDIFKHISRKGRIEERHTRQIIYKIVDAIRCFHEHDFVHRDLKPENIVFVHQNDISDIRLIDFGESIRVEPQSCYNEFVGTPCYFAPERFRQHTGAELKKSDVWAIGVIMFEMLTGCRCFNGGDNQWQVRNNVLNKEMEEWPPNLILSPHAMDFFNKLLEYEPLKRYSCQQALRHDWFSDLFHNNHSFHVSPRLTPLQNAVKSAKNSESMQAIVIKTSQSMTNLQAAIEQQMDARIKRKKIERKYKDINTNITGNHSNKNNDNNTNTNNTENEENGNDNALNAVPWKLSITRKKSRSLTQNELRATLRGKDANGTFQRLSLPKHGDKYRIKHRSQTLGSRNAINTSETEAINLNTNILAQAEESQLQGKKPDDGNEEEIEDMIVLKHEKSLSSPAMSIYINNSVVKGYLPSPVHEDSELNDIDSVDVESMHSNQWRHMHTHTNSKSSYFGQPQQSVSYSANNNHANHEKNNSFSMNSTGTISDTEDKPLVNID